MDEIGEQRASILTHAVPMEDIEAMCRKLAERAALLDFDGRRFVLRLLVEKMTASRAQVD